MAPGLFAGDLTRELGFRFVVKSRQRARIGRVAAVAKNSEGGAGQNR